jgi:hypothetical protein
MCAGWRSLRGAHDNRQFGGEGAPDGGPRFAALLLWWLNKQGRVFPAGPTTGFCPRGNLGRQVIWIDPARDLVIVSRWSDDVGALIAAVSEAVPICSPCNND